VTELNSLQNILGVTFRDVSFLQQALAHRSYLNENEDFPLPSNERLEFLGDSLLDLVIAGKLYADFPDLPEGDLTRLRSALVRTEMLASVAHSLNLGQYLYLARGEEASGGRQRQRNLAATLEAIIGAVFVDQGFDTAKDFVLRMLSSELERVTKAELPQDPKSKLQQVIQAKQQFTPVYRTVDTSGPDHDRVFAVEVFAGETLLGRGSGKSKRAAEQEAAKTALQKLEVEEGIV